MADDVVIFNGVEMDPEWAAEIEESQRRSVYTIDGVPIPRVRYGDETEDWGADKGPCHDCDVLKGQFHVFGKCDAERCPVCGSQALGCECDYEGDEED